MCLDRGQDSSPLNTRISVLTVKLSVDLIITELDFTSVIY